MQTPREACEMHYVKWGEKNDEKKKQQRHIEMFLPRCKFSSFNFYFLFDLFFFLFPNFFSFFLFVTDVLLAVEPWLWCGKLRFANCSVALFFGFFWGSGEKTETALTPPPHPILLLLPPPSLHQPAWAAAAAGSAVVILTCSLRHEHQSATPPLLPSRPSSGPDPPSSWLPLSLTPVF